MFDYVPYLSFLTSGVGILFIGFLLLRFNRQPKVYGLVFIIFALVFLEYYIYALTSKHIYQMLFLLRTPNIIRAFLPIVLFLYVRSMVYPEKKINGKQWLHFLFPLAILIGVMPDLLLSSAQKVEILDHYYQKNNYFINTPSGWIPAGYVQPVSILVGVLYGALTLWTIRIAKKIYGINYVLVNKQSLFWLILLSGTVMFYFLLQLYQYLNLFVNNSFDPPSQIIKCVIGIFLFSYFISTPNVQENMDGCILPKEKGTPSLPEILPDLIENSPEAMSLNQYLSDSQCFLQEDLDLTALAKSLEMSTVKLSKLIKQAYGMSFAELINRFRIPHFLSQRESFTQYTLETYIYQSGFANRSTFYAAFKKYVGVNPSFYLKEIKR
ncbi:MAG: helix-turn-helix domain-containing protein [Aquirufa sp.]